MNKSMTPEVPPRHYLWHLGFSNGGSATDPVTLKVEEVWKAISETDASAPVKVALIDTGVDTQHPNLGCAMSEDQVDFGPVVTGATYKPRQNALRALRRKLAADKDVTFEELESVRNEMTGNRGFERRKKVFETLEKILASDSEKLEITTASTAPKPSATEIAELKDVLFGDTSGGNQARRALQNDGANSPSLDGLFKISKDVADLWRKVHGSSVGPQKIENAPEIIATDDPSGFFAPHGTACAGLVAGRAPEDENDTNGPIKYFGVNPFCQLVSYATPYSHEYLPTIYALCRAYVSGAEVILMPRGLPDADARARHAELSGHKTRITETRKVPQGKGERGEKIQPDDQADYGKLQLHKQLLEALIKAIASERYLVLAAGNDGLESDFSYPASAETIKGDDNVIIVGARNSEGNVAAYSNGKKSDKVLWMLSDDAIVFDANTYSIDERSFVGSDFSYSTHLAPAGPKENSFDPWGILSLDVRGSYGYSAGGPDDPPEDYPGDETRGLYTIFGGTSAASSMMAGAISLLIQLGGEKGLDRAKKNVTRDHLVERLSTIYKLVRVEGAVSD